MFKQGIIMGDDAKPDLAQVFETDLRIINAQSSIYDYTQAVNALCGKFDKLWNTTDNADKPALTRAFIAAIENQADTLPQAETVNGLHASAEMTGAMFDALMEKADKGDIPDSLSERFMAVSEKLSAMSRENYGAKAVHEMRHAATLMENKALKLKLGR